MIDRRTFIARAAGTLAWLITPGARYRIARPASAPSDLQRLTNLSIEHLQNAEVGLIHSGAFPSIPVKLGPTFLEFAARKPDGSFGGYRAIGVIDEMREC
jgi:hypothetical protein